MSNINKLFKVILLMDSYRFDEIENIRFEVKETFVDISKSNSKNLEEVKPEGSTGTAYVLRSLEFNPHSEFKFPMEFPSWCFVWDESLIEQAKQFLLSSLIQSITKQHSVLEQIVRSFDNHSMKKQLADQLVSQIAYAKSLHFEQESNEDSSSERVISLAAFFTKEEVVASAELLWIVGESDDGSDYEVSNEAYQSSYLTKSKELSLLEGSMSAHLVISADEKDYFNIAWNFIEKFIEHSKVTFYKHVIPTYLNKIRAVSQAVLIAKI